jgi:regulator of sigma E protease
VIEATRLLSLGVSPARTNTLVNLNNPVQRRRAIADFDSVGLKGIEPGMTLVSVDGLDARGPQDIANAARRSDGKPVALIFRDDDGKNVPLTLTPEARFETARLKVGAGNKQRLVQVQHLAGLSGAVRVASMPEGSEAGRAGILAGDVVARVGSVEYPSSAACITEIRAHAGKLVPLTVLREVGNDRRLVEIEGARVSRDGTLGIHIGDSLLEECLVGSREVPDEPASTIDIPPGSRIVRVGDKAVNNGASLRRELQRAIDLAFNNSTGAEITLWVAPPTDGVPGPTENAVPRTLRLAQDDVKELAALGWDLPIPADIFEIQKSTMRAGDPVSALKAGLAETKRVMVMTYLTFVRLVQGSIKVDQLKGPVGIAHLGTLVADRGIIWLLFFLALISVNLAVVNFLPLPIVDGGQFLFILYEWIRGRPVPVAVQNGVTLAGLVMIGAMFLLVTYNDVRNLLGI